MRLEFVDRARSQAPINQRANFSVPRRVSHDHHLTKTGLLLAGAGSAEDQRDAALGAVGIGIVIDLERVVVASDRPEAIAGLALVPEHRRLGAENAPRFVLLTADKSVEVGKIDLAELHV